MDTQQERVQFEFGFACDVGRKRRREPNQDTVEVVLPAAGERWHPPLLLVADGLGKYFGGAFASQLVIREQGKKRRGPTVTPQSQASQLLKKLSRNQDPEHDNDAKYDHTRVTIPDGLFLHAKSPDHLLAFAMLHNRADNSYSWPANFAKAYRRFHTDDQGKALPDIDKGILSLARNGADCLIDLAHDRIRTFHQN